MNKTKYDQPILKNHEIVLGPSKITHGKPGTRKAARSKKILGEK